MYRLSDLIVVGCQTTTTTTSTTITISTFSFCRSSPLVDQYVFAQHNLHWQDTIALAEPGAFRGNRPPSTPFDDYGLLVGGFPGKLGVLLHKGLELIRFQQPVELLEVDPRDARGAEFASMTMEELSQKVFDATFPHMCRI